MFLEKVMDLEFQDASVTDKAVFYTDKHLSFSSVLLYGHEFSLTFFDLVLFIFVDVLAEDFLLAGIVTFIVGEVRKIKTFDGDHNTILDVETAPLLGGKEQLGQEDTDRQEISDLSGRLKTTYCNVQI